MANKIMFGTDLIKVLEKEYKLNKLGEVPTKYKNGIITIDFIYGKEKDIDDLKYDKPYIEFSIDDETDGFISGTMYLNGGVEGIQFDSWEDLKYFMKNAKWIESEKSARKSLKEEKATNSLFENVVFSMIKKFKLKKEYDVERPSWTVFNFRHKNKDAQFSITFDERGHGDFLYGDVLAFGDEKDDIFKYKTDEVKIDSYNIEKECLNIIADCLAFIDVNKKITIFESKKSVRKSLEEGINDELIATSSDGETTLYLSDERQANHGKDPHYEFKLGENGYFTRYIRCDDNRCENVVLDWIKEFDLDISKSEISKIIKLHESNKSTRKSMKEGKDSAFYDGIAKEFHFSKNEKTRYKDKTYISAIAVLFDRINNAIKTYGRNSDEEYNALNDCWEVISSAKQNGFNVDYDEDRWNKIAGLPNYH